MRTTKLRWVEILFMMTVIMVVAVLSIMNWMREEVAIVYPQWNDGKEEVVIVPVTGNTGLVNLACGTATQIILDDGSSVILPKLDPCDMSVIAGDVKANELPSNLPNAYHFIDATNVNVIYKGEALKALPENKKVEVSFSDNAKELKKGGFLSVLHWTGNQWKEVAFDSRLRALSNELGLFVLVRH